MAMKQTMQAVYDDDLVELLTSLGLYQKFVSGQLHCAICGDEISWENLNGLFPESGQIKFGCTRPECVTGLAQRISNRALA